MGDLFMGGDADEARPDYRLWLRRWWDVGGPLLVERWLLWVMLNPSVATGTKPDHTVRKVIGFSRHLGYKGAVVVNLFAIRNQDPEVLYNPHASLEDLIGVGNDEEIVRRAREADRIIVAWGAHGQVRDRDRAVMELLSPYRVECLGITNGGLPGHPRTLSYERPILEYRGRP